MGYATVKAIRNFERLLRLRHQHGTQCALIASTSVQRMLWLIKPNDLRSSGYSLRRRLVISTSRFGVGQQAGSNCTPLGLHRIAEKHGAGYPVGMVFKSRKPLGYLWKGVKWGAIAHRILWLEGIEPGLNMGDQIDSFDRYIYIHGLGNEPSLGQPASCGCIHLASRDLMPLFDQVPAGTLVWIISDPV